MNTVPDFEDMLTLLNQYSAKYLIVGGLAFIYHAKPRFTKDMDLWVEGTRENLTRVNLALAEFGSPTLMAYDEPDQIVQLGLAPNRIDFLVEVGTVQFKEAWTRRIDSSYGDVTTHWIDIDSLLKIKSAIDDPRHQEDARILRKIKKTPLNIQKPTKTETRKANKIMADNNAHKNNAFDVLRERGFIYQHTDEQQLRAHLGAEAVTFYVGFDPTADSLHIGHLLPVMAMRWLQKCGHRPIALVGGGTALVGDPSGKTESRPVLTHEAINDNAESIKKQLQRFLDFSEGKAELVNNADWLTPIKYIDFLRDAGRHFSVNRMLAAESVKQRLETGLSFLEFNYMLLQAYDFMVLNRERGCTLQLGGQDQWGNIVAGIDLTRRMSQREVFGATFPLLLKSDGEKFGKTASGAVWLDPKRTSPYDYYQFWRNVDDAEVGKLLAFFTPLPMNEIERLAALTPPAINRAKEILAFEATLLAHDQEEARKSYLAAGNEFGFADPANNIPTSSAIREVSIETTSQDLPTYAVSQAQTQAGVWIVQLLNDCGLCKSNGDARRLLRGGGCYIDDERVNDEKLNIDATHFKDGQLTLKAGKKNLRRIIIN